MITAQSSKSWVTTYRTRDEWLTARRRSIGASESPGILGLGYAGQSPYSIWASKVGLDEPHIDSERLEIGRLIEPGLRAIFTAKTGLSVVSVSPYVVHYNSERPHLSCTPDGIVMGKEARTVPIELKFVGSHNREQWQDDKIPLAYQVQVQHQLYVMDHPYGYLMGLVGNEEVHIHKIERNDRFLSALLPTLDAFWECVANHSPPPVDGTVATAETLKRIYPADDGNTVPLGDDYAEKCRQLQILKAGRKTIEEQILGIENDFRAALGPASVGLLADGRQITYRTQQRKGYVVEPSTYRVLRFPKETT